MQKIVAYIGYCTVQALDFGFELLPVGGKLHSFCQLPLQLCQLLFMLAETVQWSDRRAIGKRRKTGNAHIYADDTLRRMHRFWNFPFRLNGDVPLSSGKRDCHLFRRSLYFAAVAVAYPPDFGKEYAVVPLVQLEALRIAKSIVKTFLLETWEPSTLLKEVFVGSIEVFQGLLQNLRMGFRKKGCFFLLFPVPKELAE